MTIGTHNRPQTGESTPNDRNQRTPELDQYGHPKRHKRVVAGIAAGAILGVGGTVGVMLASRSSDSSGDRLSGPTPASASAFPSATTGMEIDLDTNTVTLSAPSVAETTSAAPTTNGEVDTLPAIESIDPANIEQLREAIAISAETPKEQLDTVLLDRFNDWVNYGITYENIDKMLSNNPDCNYVGLSDIGSGGMNSPYWKDCVQELEKAVDKYDVLFANALFKDGTSSELAKYFGDAHKHQSWLVLLQKIVTPDEAPIKADVAERNDAADFEKVYDIMSNSQDSNTWRTVERRSPEMKTINKSSAWGVDGMTFVTDGKTVQVNIPPRQ